MACCVEVIVDVEVVGEIVGGEAGVASQNLAHIGKGGVEAFGANVDLGPVARREHYGFGDVVGGDEII